MSPEKFAYWLQGWIEMEQGKRPNLDQWKMIVSHLSLVFEKVTPTLEDTNEDVLSTSLADVLDQINNAPERMLDEILTSPPHHTREFFDRPICSDVAVCSPAPNKNLTLSDQFDPDPAKWCIGPITPKPIRDK